jgi:hypothetical protein
VVVANNSLLARHEPGEASSRIALYGIKAAAHNDPAQRVDCNWLGSIAVTLSGFGVLNALRVEIFLNLEP